MEGFLLSILLDTEYLKVNKMQLLSQKESQTSGGKRYKKIGVTVP